MSPIVPETFQLGDMDIAVVQPFMDFISPLECFRQFASAREASSARGLHFELYTSKREDGTTRLLFGEVAREWGIDFDPRIQPSENLERLLSLASRLRQFATIFTPGPDVLAPLLKFHVNATKLDAVLQMNQVYLLQSSSQELVPDRQTQFRDEIFYRCLYICSFRNYTQYGLTAQHVQGSNRYFPCLGPYITLGCWIYEMGILKEPVDAHFASNDLVQMYGFGTGEIRWLQNNRNPTERREQLDTLEKYHILRAWLGEPAVADLAKQLRYCCLTIRDSKAAGNWGKTEDNRARYRRLCAVRVREFKIAKIMAERIWDEVDETRGTRRSRPLLRERVVSHDGRVVTISGGWKNLQMEDKSRLLGGPTEYHTCHPEFAALSQFWLQEAVVAAVPAPTEPLTEPPSTPARMLVPEDPVMAVPRFTLSDSTQSTEITVREHGIHRGPWDPGVIGFMKRPRSLPTFPPSPAYQVLRQTLRWVEEMDKRRVREKSPLCPMGQFMYRRPVTLQRNPS
ncbi:hypothetical protein JX266_000695 [Neoarthrinium moseri]|nr:hypothetical protein JX266_000695 [Neoarthrinium moseri]